MIMLITCVTRTYDEDLPGSSHYIYVQYITNTNTYIYLVVTLEGKQTVVGDMNKATYPSTT